MLKAIKLENFRNHLGSEFSLGELNIIVGRNGIGKSNILEAISIISCCRSFRNEDKRNLIHYGADYTRVSSHDFEIFLQRNPKLLFQAKYKGTRRKKSEYIGLLPSVIFSPETMEIITGSPQERRRFLDVMISQADRLYLDSLIAFEKARLERNNLLQMIREGRSNRDELEFWNQELVGRGLEVTAGREKVINFLNKHILTFYRKVSGAKSELMVKYQRSAELNYRERLREIEMREIQTGHTLIGPHRDDFIVVLDGKDMAKYGSRGEVRSAILALKMAEVNYIEQNPVNSVSKPILLLDDIFSEFDKFHRLHLFKLIEGYQTIITTTDKEFVDPVLLKRANLIEL